MPVSQDAASQAAEQDDWVLQPWHQKSRGSRLASDRRRIRHKPSAAGPLGALQSHFLGRVATPKPPPVPTASDASEESEVTPRRVADIEGQRKG